MCKNIKKDLEIVAKYILFEAHKMETKEKGSYETRRRLEKTEDGLWDVKGSGDCNKMAKKIYDCIKRL